MPSYLQSLKEKHPRLAEFYSDDEIIDYLPTYAPEEFGGLDREQIKFKALDDRTAIRRGFSAGVDQLQAMGGGLVGMAGDAAGIDSVRDWGLDLYRRNMEEAALSAPETNFLDIDGVGDALNWAGYTIGNLAPMMATSIAGGGAGGILANQATKKTAAAMLKNLTAKGIAAEAAKQEVGKFVAKRVVLGQALGAAAASSGMSSGSLYGDTEDPAVSAVHGAISGSIDALPVMRIFGRFGVAQAAKEALETSVIREIATQGLAEASTEGVQTIVEQHAKYWVENEGRSLLNNFSDVDWREVAEATAAGALGGGVMGGGASVVSGDPMLFRRPVPQKPEDELNKAIGNAERAAQETLRRGGDALDAELARAGTEEIELPQAVLNARETARKLYSDPAPTAPQSPQTIPGQVPTFPSAQAPSVDQTVPGQWNQPATAQAPTIPENPAIDPLIAVARRTGDDTAVARLEAAKRMQALSERFASEGNQQRATNMAERATAIVDDVRGRLPAEPEQQQEQPAAGERISIWTGRRGDGYETTEAAEAGLATRQRVRADLDWRVERMPSGKYQLSGYSRQGQARDRLAQPDMQAVDSLAQAKAQGEAQRAGQPDPAVRQMQGAAIDRAMRSIERRGGVATQAEADLLAEYGMGAPFDRIEGPAVQPTENLRMSSSGKPFQSEKQARSSVPYRQNPGATVVASGDGFAVQLPAVKDPEQAIAKAQSLAAPQEANDQEWSQFTPETGTLGVPRETMPQIKAEHRGAMVNFLKGRFISSEIQQVPANTLKPTQAEFSREKVKQALDYKGGNRSILVSSDNYVVDGHHQWLANLDGDIQVIRIDAPVQEILDVIKEFPSATSGEAAPAPAYSSDLITFARKAKSLSEVREFARKQFGPRAPQALEQAITGAWNIRNQENRRRIGKDDSLATAVAKLGGIKPEWQQDITGDTKANKMIPGVGQVFSKNGTSPDDMALRLLEEGYITQAEYDNMDGRDTLYEALNEELAGGRKKYKLDSDKAQEEMLQALEDQYAQEEEALKAQREQMYAQIEKEYGAEAAERAKLYDEAQDNITDDLLSDIDILNQLNQERDDARETDGEPGITFDEAAGNREPIRSAQRETQRQPEEVARDQAQDRGAAGPVTSAPAPQAAASSEAVVVSGQQESPAQVTNLEDFGEKLGGSRKDRARMASMSEDMTAAEIVGKSLSQIWPKSDVDAIEDKAAAAFAFGVRSEIPSKPRKPYAVKAWAEKIIGVRELVKKYAEDPAEIEKRMREAGGNLRDFINKIDLLRAIDREQWGRIGSVHLRPDAYRYDENGEKTNSPFLFVNIDGRHHNIAATTIADAVDRVNALLGKEAAAQTKKFEIRGYKNKNDWFIIKKGDGEYRRLKSFSGETALADARKFIDNNEAQLEAEWEKIKERDNIKKSDVRNKDNRPRTGKDYRKGKDVTPEQFSKEFGFRGVEFGNWVNQGSNAKERQGMLNQAYDALMDLSQIVGIPPKAISLNGSMGLAFGARGSGSASAHFEPGNLVINLTKTRGAGTLAHEWFHALDNYFSRLRGGEIKMTGALDAASAYRKNNYITYRPEPLYVHKSGRMAPMTKAKLEMYREKHPTAGIYKEENWQVDPAHPEGVRPEVERAFADLVETLDESPMRQRASAIDEGKAEGYWSRIIERAARSFENYVITKMHNDGYDNDYLANVRDWESWGGKNPERYPYLRPEEIAPVAEAFDALFSTIKTRETESGVALFSRSDDTPDLLRPIGESRMIGDEKLIMDTPDLKIFEADPPYRTRSMGRSFRYVQYQDGKPIGAIQFLTSGPRSKKAVIQNIYTAEENRRQKVAASLLRRAQQDFEIRHSTDLTNSGKAFKAADGVRYSRGSATSIPIDRAQALVSAITGRLENAPEVIVVQSMQDDQVPEAVRREDARQRSQGASGEPEGFYYRGKAYIVLDGLSRRKGENDAQALLRVFSHEILGHAGLRGLFRSDLDAVLNEVSLKRLSDVRKKAAEYGLDLADKSQRMEAAEEVLAEMAQTNPENSIVTKAIEAVRRALRRMLMRLPADIRTMLGGSKFIQWVDSMTDAEIVDRFIAPAREFIRGGNQAGMNAMPAFMRSGPWYRSELQQNIGQIRQMANKQGMIGKDQASQWIDAAIKKGLFKAEEVEWTGLKEFIDMADGRLSVDDIQAFVDGNGVRVQEVVLGEVDSNQAAFDAVSEYAKENGLYFDERGTNGYGYLIRKGENGSLSESDGAQIEHEGKPTEIAEELDLEFESDNTEFGSPDLVLPGGENYREVLLTLPAKKTGKFTLSLGVLGIAGPNRSFDTREDAQAFIDSQVAAGNAIARDTTVIDESERNLTYFSSHWKETPNVIAHIRMNDREIVTPFTADEQAAIRANEAAQQKIKDLQRQFREAERDSSVRRDIRIEAVKAELRPQVRAGKMSISEFNERIDAVSSNDPRVRRIADEIRQLQDSLPAMPKQKRQKVLFIEEIQSDWAQEGRKKGIGLVAGYRVVEPSGQLFGEYQTRRDADGALQRAKPGSVVERSDTTYQGVPEAPFIGNTKAWTSLALKRIIAIAAEGDYDKVAFVNGEQSADRYDLSKKVHSVSWQAYDSRGASKIVIIEPFHGNTIELPIDSNGVVIKGQEQFTGKPIDQVVGKEIAERIMGERAGQLSGNGLSIGGTGMKSFYDQIIPATLKDLSKKLGGGPLESITITNQEEDFDYEDLENATDEEMAQLQSGGIALSQPGITITDAMREKVASGLPLFSRDMFGGQDDFNLDQYSEEEISQREQMERDRKAQTAKALQKQEADDQLGEFVLTGSDSAADQAAARGQGSLFSRSKALPDTINIDGTARPTTNNNGQPIAQNERAIRAFWKWFGDSKAVDDQGRPVVMYHGTPGDVSIIEFDLEKANKYDPDIAAVGFHFTSRRDSADTAGRFPWRRPDAKSVSITTGYLSIKNPATRRDVRRIAGQTGGSNQEVTDALIAAGYDGVVMQKIPRFTKEMRAAIKAGERVEFKPGHYLEQDGEYGLGYYADYVGGHVTSYDSLEDFLESEEDHYVAFSPAQIKSATSNTGTFDPADNDIRFSRRDSTGFAVPDETLVSVAIRKIQDKFKVLKDLQANILKAGGEITEENNAYLAEELFHGKAENDIRQMQEQYIEPLAKKMAEFGITRTELDKFLYARHAGERNARIAEINPEMPDGGSGMTDAEARAELDRIRGTGKQGQYEQLAGIVYDMLQLQRDMVRQGGLESDPTIDAWEEGYQFYVPLKGWAEDTKQEGMPRTGKGFAISGRESKRALGRSSQAASPTSFTINDLTEKLIRRRKNEVGNAFLKLVRSNPNPEYWQVFSDEKPDTQRSIKKVKDPETGEMVEQVTETAIPMAMLTDRYFTTKKNGKTFYIKLEDPRLMKAMKNIGPESNGALIRTMAGITRVMSALNTSYSPEFMVSNFARDVQTALLNLQAEQSLPAGKASGVQIAKKTMKDVPKAMKAIYGALRGTQGRTAEARKWQALFEQFREDGAKTGWFDSKDLDGQSKSLDNLVAMAEGGFKGKAMLWMRESAKLVENMNQSVENAVRLAAYANAIDAGISRKQAASLAKNMTVNFNRRGEVGTVLNAIYMFANASIQGTANFVRTMGTLKGEGGPTWSNLNNAQKIAIGMMASAYFIGQANRMSAGDDEDDENWYDKVPDYVKERNIVIMKSMFGGPQDGSYWKIPLPYGYNVFYVLGNGVEAVTGGGKSVSQSATNISLAALGSFSPIGFQTSESGANMALKNMAPTIIKPIVEVALNENFMGSSIYTENLPFGTPRPDSALGRNSTPEAYRKLALWLNEVTGGTEYRPGAVDINPDVMQHFLDFFGGSAYAFFGSKIPDAVHRAAAGVVAEENRVPFLSRISGQVLPYADTEKFYQRRDTINQLYDEYRALPTAERSGFEDVDLVRMRPLLRTTERKLAALRKKRDAIYSADMSLRERDPKLKEVEAQMKVAIDRFNKAFTATDQ